MRNRTMHDLKCWDCYFEAVDSGLKTFEIRLNDRDYKLHDSLLLREWDPARKVYTGRALLMRVTYIFGSPTHLPIGYLAMSIQPAGGNLEYARELGLAEAARK